MLYIPMPMGAASSVPQRCWQLAGVVFQEVFEIAEHVVPLGGDFSEAAARIVHRFQFDSPLLLATLAAAAQQACTFEDVEMFGNRLAGDLFPAGEGGNGLRAAGDETGDDAQP